MNIYSTEEKQLISALLARAGFFVSFCDDTDADERSEKLETLRMVKAVTSIAARSSNTLIAFCAKAALENIFPVKADTQEKLSADLRSIVALFTARDDATALDQFRKAVMYVATSVARAYREEVDHHEDEFILETVLNRISAYLNKESDPAEFRDQNVSPAEFSALTFISKALRS